MKKWLREDSGSKNPRKSLLVADICDDSVEEVSLTTPPLKLKKRPREDSLTETPRKRSFGAVRVKDDECEKIKVFTFCVLLPNGTSVDVKMSEVCKEIPIEEFIDAVRKAYELLINQKRSLSQKRRIIWEYQDLYFTDVHAKKIRIKVDFRDFSYSNWHLLWLHDGSPEPDQYEDMWDLTPDTNLLKELPDDYTWETALADIIDNSLQALWSNEKGERKLISVEIQAEKITIFDSGPGMDGADGNIVKWGKMGASLHRSVREKAIGGKPPYLKPFFGMFGYGGPIATMCLGRRAVVSSKTKKSTKVFTLHMEREALVSASHSENCWKTKGGVRDPYEDEKLNSPHGSFTKVEIFDPKPKAMNLNIDHLRCKLKDIYFPYIQCDELSGKTKRPIKFQVNGVDLVEIPGGEVATTNLHSCNGPDFTVQLHLSIRPESLAGHNQREFTTANARLKCVYFPIVEGTENIERILDELDKDGRGIKESFESFSRVSVRRLGRLLPDTRWGLLPFMEPKQRIGEKAHYLKKLCSRVKCFIDTDSGFNPSPHKTDLAHHHPFTKAIKNFGYRSTEDENGLIIKISKDGEKLSLNQLENLYHDWISDMHERYDEELNVGLDEPTILVSSKIKKLDLSSKVLRIHKRIRRKGKVWTSGQNIKVLKGACAGCHHGNVYATLEYIILEGLEGDVPGEARLICRPLGLPENKGCCLSTRDDGSSTFDISGSSVFPIRIIDSGKCLPVDDSEWERKLMFFNQKLPASIDLLSRTDCQELEIDGGFPVSLESRDCFPENVVAVVRPKAFHSGKCSKRLDQKFIVRDNLDMTLDIVKRRASYDDDGKCDLVYSVRRPPSCHNDLSGLYIFQLSTKRQLQEPGTFMFSFSLAEFHDIQLEREVQVGVSAGVGKWEVLNHDKNDLYTISAGSYFKPISIVCYDAYKKRVRFGSVPKLLIELKSRDKTLAQASSKKVEITHEKLTMRIKALYFKTCELDYLRPNYEATIHISTPDKAFSVALPCQVLPAIPKRITVHPKELPKQLLPGQIINELALEVFDEYGNHVKEDESILVRVEGFSFEDGSGITSGVVIDCIKKVDKNGRVDLSNVLKVSRGYGKRVVLRVLSNDYVIFELLFQTEMRALRAVQKAAMNCEAGSLLQNIAFEVIDSEGKVDESIHNDDKYGPSHTLTIKCDTFRINDSVRYSFVHGRCTIPSIRLPCTEGVVVFQAKHSCYPELKSDIKVFVKKTRQCTHGSVTIPAKGLSKMEMILQDGSSDILQGQIAAQVSEKLSNSTLISQKKHQQEERESTLNHEDVGNIIIISPKTSSEQKQILPASPSFGVSQELNDETSPHSSERCVSLSPRRSSDQKQILPAPPSFGVSQEQSYSPASSTPKSKHTTDALDKKYSLKELGDEIVNTALQKSKHEENLKILQFKLSQNDSEILQLQADIGPDLANASNMCGLQSTLQQIRRRSQSAAAGICKMLEDEQRSHGIVGVVALLGTVESTDLSRMLSQYLGADQMLAVVCRSIAASHSLASLGLSNDGGYNAFCLEDIRPASIMPRNDLKELQLPFQPPTLPNGTVPHGFLGYAVNLIRIEPSHLYWRTNRGHDLQETLFYRLFGDLQVYKDRACMMAAQSCITTGAVSLDGGIMRGNGHISLGNWKPKIMFPVMNNATFPESLRILEAKRLEHEKIEQRIIEENDKLGQSIEKLQILLPKYRSFISQSGPK